MKAPVSITSFRPQKSIAIVIGVLAVVVLPFLSWRKFPRVIRLWFIRDYRPTAATSNRHK